MSEHLDNVTYTSPEHGACSSRSQSASPLNQEEHESLCHSLREEGLVHPIAVRKLGEEEFEVIAGERRWRAAKDVGWANIDAKVFICTEQQARRMASSRLRTAIRPGVSRED